MGRRPHTVKIRNGQKRSEEHGSSKIGSILQTKKKDGVLSNKCGGRSASFQKRKNYPKCVPIAKARAMSRGQSAGAVARKLQAKVARCWW